LTGVGACVGAAIAAGIAPLTRAWFSVPAGGVGIVTITGYPKPYDYALVALLVAGSAIGGLSLSTVCGPALAGPGAGPGRLKPAPTLLLPAIVFVHMLFVHDHPYAGLEPFHEGEHLTPGFLFRSGERPYGDVFVLHGLAVDGGLDAFVLGDPPSPRRVRRLETLLNAATLALLVPIAAEITTTTAGAAAAAFIGLCAIAAGQLAIFPFFRLAPIFLAAWPLLRYVRWRSVNLLVLASVASSVGLLWSLDTGLYAFAATVIVILILRPRAVVIPLIALALPLLILLAVRADLHRFVVDSFITIPRSIDAIWSRPAPIGWSWETARYYVPPIFFGWLLASAIRKRDARMAIVAIFSIVAFRTAAGRCSWSHTRYGIPLLGVAIVAFALEPLVMARRRVFAILLAIVLFVYAEVGPNVTAAGKFVAGWRRRQSHVGLVPYPLATGRGIYTNRENASDLAALNGLLDATAPPGAPILDVSNERALYYLLQRRPPTRCADIPMLSAPPLMSEAMQQLQANPPACVVLEGLDAFAQFDGVPNHVRVPALFAWIDAHYPRRIRTGRYLVATQ
jgi:hypothetical protein